MAWLAATGALALTFAFSGIPFLLTADSLTGDGFVQYAYPDKTTSAGTGVRDAARSLSGVGTINNTAQGPDGVYVSDTVTQFRSADIGGLNQVICSQSPIGGNIKVTLSGSGTTTASDLVIQSPALRAKTATFDNIIIGESVHDSLTGQGFGANNQFTDPYGALSGAPVGGSFAQNATHAVLNGISQVGIGTMAGSFAISDLNLYAEFVGTCPAPAQP